MTMAPLLSCKRWTRIVRRASAFVHWLTEITMQIATQSSTSFQNPLGASPLIFPIVECRHIAGFILNGRHNCPRGFSSAQLGYAKADARGARRRYQLVDSGRLGSRGLFGISALFGRSRSVLHEHLVSGEDGLPDLRDCFPLHHPAQSGVG